MVTRPEWCTGFGGQTYTDNYYELSPEDSERWLILISRAYGIAPDLASRLLYFRNSGSKLIRSDEFGYKIVPVIGNNGWKSRDFYDEEVEKYLKPVKEQVVELLRGLK
jgi:hypothetical protein